MPESIPISVLILTKNEAVNLPGCLASVTWSDDVVVFDSFSEDQTVAIAEAGGARVFQRKFDDYGSQREAARTSVDYRHPWLLVLDADERPDDELVRELAALVRDSSPTHIAYRVRHKHMFMDRWLKHASLYPSWSLRVFQPARACYEPRAVHEHLTVDGTVGELQGHLLHYSFNKGMDHWYAKHRQYAALEAKENFRQLRGGRVDWAGLLAFSDPMRRRRALKQLSMRLPCRGLLRFLYMYVIRLGVLDGYPGYRYCRMLAWYEGLIVRELQSLRKQGGKGASAGSE